MPSSRTVQERAAAEVARVYAEAEARLLALLARRAAAGLETGYDGWAAAKAHEAAELARAAAALEGDLTATVTRLLQALVTVANIEAAGAPAVAGTPAAVQLLVQEAVEGVTASHTRLLRWVDDVFRQVQAEVAEAMATGTTTLTQAVQTSLNRYAERGVRGFIDGAGRSWGLQEYAEMATRTAVGRAHVGGTLDRYRGQGRQLVIVSDSPDECPVCRPWEGRVLGIDQAIVDGERYPTVADAISAGLLHPNCTHNLGAYVPGLTRAMTGTENPEGYELRQEQRYRERQVRKWRRRQAVAITPEEQARAARYLAANRARYNQFIDRTGRIPQPWRTRVLRPSP